MVADGMLHLGLAPMPVYPRPIKFHGLLGQSFVSHHLIIDDRWTTNSLMETFKCVTDVLMKRRQFYNIDKKMNRKHMIRRYRQLKRQIRDVRMKLQNSIKYDNARKIRNLLVNHKDMQRSYQKTPLHVIVNNITTRTFVLRKECDHLFSRLNKLKDIYDNKLRTRADLENRINYQNEFMLEEELKLVRFRNEIKKSGVRLEGIKTINTTYKKMIQLLCHDEIFHEPILRSLNNDYEDLSAFIKYILYLGHPAIKRFNELSNEYWTLERNLKMRTSSKPLKPKPNSQKYGSTMVSINEQRHYVRKTISMTFLKNELQRVEDIIRDTKVATLSTQVGEILPRMIRMNKTRDKAEKLNEIYKLENSHLNDKEQRAKLMQILLINNETEEEIKRLQTIKKLKEDIAAENVLRAKIIQHIKNRNDFYILLRFTLWNLSEILKNVGPVRSRKPVVEVETSYLNWPLLKFSMLAPRPVSRPPAAFQTNVDIVLNTIKAKLKKLMERHARGRKVINTRKCRDIYDKKYLEANPLAGSSERAAKSPPTHRRQQAISAKITQKILDNSAVKALSHKVIEENIKKDEM